MASVFDHLHIKRHTAGSSNELSFDVLENASSGLTDKETKSQRLPKPAKASQGSYQGVKGTTTLGSQEEVLRRKKARRARTIRLWVLAAVFALATIVALVWLGYRHYLEVQDFSTRFDSLVNQLVEEDEFLSQIDMLVSKLDEATTPGEREALTSRIPQAIEDTRQIAEKAKSTSPLVVSEQDEVALGQLIETTEARVRMLEAAQDVLSQADARDTRAKEVSDIWNEVVGAGQQAKEASAEANAATTESQTKDARDRTKAIYDKEQAILTGLRDLANQDPQFDASAQIAFIEAKLRSLSYAVETGDALLDGNRELAAEKNDAYNKADLEATELAKKLPLSMEDIVKEAYATKISELTKAYEEARDKVIAADALVRDYLSSR